MSVDGFSLLGFYVVYMLTYVWAYMYIWGGGACLPACVYRPEGDLSYCSSGMIHVVSL